MRIIAHPFEHSRVSLAFPRLASAEAESKHFVTRLSHMVCPMTPTEQRAVLTIALTAAFADGLKDDRERDALKRVAESLAGPNEPPLLATVYQEVLLKRVNLAQVAASISDPAHLQLAYELAVCVCDADGVTNDSERQFLSGLKQTLGLSNQPATFDEEAEALAAAPLPTIASLSPAMAASSSLSARSLQIPEDELDQYILNHSIVNGALELLPQSLASMAIIALQIKLVYRVGKAYGHELDQGHIKEFLATVGVGMTSQYVEQIGRKLLGGLLGGIAGSIGRGLGRVATGAAFSFATTYALGQLAKRYYAGGRQMNAALLRETYQSLLAQAQQLQSQYSTEIQQKARSLDIGQVMSIARGP
jgi:uncharacterized protein (DUF697 family)/tellurite resistance protein